MLRKRTRAVIDQSLNVLFAVWVVYFLATGTLIPTKLLPDRNAGVAAVAAPETGVDGSPPSLPLELPDES